MRVLDESGYMLIDADTQGGVMTLRATPSLGLRIGGGFAGVLGVVLLGASPSTRDLAGTFVAVAFGLAFLAFALHATGFTRTQRIDRDARTVEAIDRWFGIMRRTSRRSLRGHVATQVKRIEGRSSVWYEALLGTESGDVVLGSSSSEPRVKQLADMVGAHLRGDA